MVSIITDQCVCLLQGACRCFFLFCLCRITAVVLVSNYKTGRACTQNVNRPADCGRACVVFVVLVRAPLRLA